MAWRYIAQRISGPSKGMFLDMNLPLREVNLTDSLGPSWLTARVSPNVLVPRAEDGRSTLDKWSTAIWAELDGVIRGGGILITNDVNGPDRRIECMGYLGYPHGIPFTGQYRGVQVDPTAVYRMLWDHIQSFGNGDLGLTVVGDTSPVRIGKPPGEVAFQTGAGTPVSFNTNDGPYDLNWWEAPDIGDTMNWLASTTPFDVRERHYWNAAKTEILHEARIGYPRLGRRRDDLSFIVGQNVVDSPKIVSDGEEFANAAIGLGAGEGRTMVRSPEVSVNDGRLRRVAVVARKDVKSRDALTQYARTEARARSTDFDLGEIHVVDHPNARIGTWEPGDEIFVQGQVGTTPISAWCRIVSSTIQPDIGNRAILDVERV